MEPIDKLEVGLKYSKNDLSTLINEPQILTVREGVASCVNSNAYLLFVDLEKKDKEQRFHFDDFFEEDYFHWDSQTTQHINTPKIQDIIKGELVAHLFVRITQKKKSKTLPFVYCGKLLYKTHEEGTARPVHIVFQNIDYNDDTENQDLLDIYRWKPTDAGMTTKTKIVKKGIISEERKKRYKKPDMTERKGLVTSRVGQGFYRQQIINKWGGKCPLTDIDISSILIASHIVPWAESNDAERLDVDNGILLSPLFDALFDRYLISFEDDGALLVSSRMSSKHIKNLSLKSYPKIPINDGMLQYLHRHRKRFLELSND